MISAIVNALVVVVGSLIGCFFRKRLSERALFISMMEQE